MVSSEIEDLNQTRQRPEKGVRTPDTTGTKKRTSYAETNQQNTLPLFTSFFFSLSFVFFLKLKVCVANVERNYLRLQRLTNEKKKKHLNVERAVVTRSEWME